VSKNRELSLRAIQRRARRRVTRHGDGYAGRTRTWKVRARRPSARHDPLPRARGGTR
jgi:hypothetical protein